MGTFWILVVIWALGWAAVCAAIGQHKNLDPTESAFWGFFLGVIGLIVVLFQSPRLPAAPEGMAAVKCPRCNAVQNVAGGRTEYECWQCHQVNPIAVIVPPVRGVTEGPKRSARCPECQIPKKIPVAATTFWCPYCRADVTP